MRVPADISVVFLAVLVLITHSIRVSGKRVPGITSIKQCYKYHGMEHFLTEEFISNTTRKIMGETKDRRNQFAYGSLGELVLRFEYPFMAALGYEFEDLIEYLCGGSLISERFVLTAAHCIISPTGKDVKHVRLGDLNIRNQSDDEGVQTFKPLRYIVHPGYRYPLKYNDIALIELDAPAILTKYVKPICLEIDARMEIFNYASSFLYAAGWGNLGYGEKPSDELQKFRLRYATFNSCRITYPATENFLPRGVLHDMQICAGSIVGLVDTCEGDSGGPLVRLSYIGDGREHVQVGITSFGVPCAIAELPAIYTRISYYVKWIEDTVWPEEFSHKFIFPDAFDRLQESLFNKNN